MSFVSGIWMDHVTPEEDGSMPGIIGNKGILGGELLHVGAPNARTQIFIDTKIGKGTDIFMGYLWQMRKKGFVIDKVQEWMEISPIHSQYYQLTVQQKQTMENQIKSSLAGIQSSIGDFELIYHDIRKYKEYMNYFEEMEKGKNEKDDDLYRKNNQTLKSIFIDQVDVHTGEGVALKLIASRWPTIIVDFMKINDKDEDPQKIAKEYGFSAAEGVVLSTKNKIYKQWRDLFKGTVKSRYQHMKELYGSRQRSIDEYRNMVKPYVMRHRMIRELGETDATRKMLQDFSWWRPSTQAVSVDMSEYWMWRPLTTPEPHRMPVQNYEEKVSLSRSDLPPIIKYEINNSSDKEFRGKNKEIKTFVTGIEPVDRWVWFLKDKMVEYYKKKFGYRVDLNIKDIMNAREKLGNTFKEYSRWDWIPSPYFQVVELSLYRLVIRSPDGNETESLMIGSYPDSPLMVVLDTQNVMILRLLEMILQKKETERYLTDMVGHTFEGRKVEDVVKEEYPNLMGDGKKIADKTKEEIKKKLEFHDPTKNMFVAKKYGFIKPGSYEYVLMDRIGPMMVKHLAGSTYASTLGYFYSAAGVP